MTGSDGHGEMVGNADGMMGRAGDAGPSGRGEAWDLSVAPSAHPPVSPSGPDGRRLGEIVESSTVEFVAQSYQLHDAPALGSLVRVGDGETATFGVVQFAATTSIDGSRKPIARGAQFADEAEVYRENPQLDKLLRTDFRALVVGFRAGRDLHQYLPPRPAHVHAFVYQCTDAEIREFTGRWDFLTLIAGATVTVSVDELLGACIREAALVRPGNRAFLVEAGKQLAKVLGSDTTRLTAVLRRFRPAGTALAGQTGNGMGGPP